MSGQRQEMSGKSRKIWTNNEHKCYAGNTFCNCRIVENRPNLKNVVNRSMMDRDLCSSFSDHLSLLRIKDNFPYIGHKILLSIWLNKIFFSLDTGQPLKKLNNSVKSNPSGNPNSEIYV